MPSAAAGPVAALGLKTRSALMSGDMDLATTTAAGAAQNAAAQAQSLAAAAAATAAPAGALPAAARSGAYRWGAMDIASHSLPAVPARSSSAGRPARPVAAIFQPGHRPAAGRSASAPRPKKRGRPPKAGGEFICPRCNVGVGSKETLNNSHYKEYEIAKPDGSTEKHRLCVTMDAKVRSLFAHFCSLSARFLLAFCSRFAHFLFSSAHICSYLLIFGSYMAHVLLTFCSLLLLFMLTFCSRFSYVFCSRFCSYFAQLYTDLLTVCSFYAHFWLIFYSLSATRLTGHKAAQGDGEDAATACWAGHTGVHTAGGARGRY